MTRILPRILLLTAIALGLAACTSSEPEPGPGGPKRLFVTSQSYAGEFGGIAAGDSVCNTLATAAVLGGTWKVFLSDSATGALARIQGNGPWVRVEANGGTGTRVFNNRTSLIVGALASINNEYGVPVTTSTRVWTGTRADGATDGAQTCANWSATAGYGSDGNPNGLLANGPIWMHSAEGASPCNLLKRLYCFEQ